MKINLPSCYSFGPSVLGIWLLIFSLQSNAQRPQIDSLLPVLNAHTSKDTTKVNQLNTLAFKYHTILPDSTILLSQQAYELAKELKYTSGQAKALGLWGVGLDLTGQTALAIEKDTKALHIYEKLNDKKGQGFIYNNLAIMYENQGKSKMALNYYFKSLKLRIDANDKVGIADCYNNIGGTYWQLGNYTQALSYYFNALSMREAIGGEVAISNSLSNIGGIFSEMGKYDDAIEYNFRALAINERIGNKQDLILNLLVIGDMYNKKAESTKALEMYNRALKLSEEMENPLSIAESLKSIGEVYINEKRYGEAENTLLKALQTANNTQQSIIATSNIDLGIVYLHTGRVPESIRYLLLGYNIASQSGLKLNTLKASESLAAAYEKLGDIKNANFFMKRQIIYKDSLLSEESNKKAQQIEFDFLLGKKQSEIAMLQKDKSLQDVENKQQRFLTLTSTLVSCLIAIIAIVLFRSRQNEKKSKNLILHQKTEIEEQAQILEELNQLKDQTFSVLSHDLRSPVASLTSLMELMDEEVITPDEFGSLKGKLNHQLKGVSLLLDNLLHWSKSHMQNPELLPKKQFSAHELTIQSVSLLKEMAALKNIKLVVDVPDSVFVFANRDQLDIVIRNLLSNAIKFTNLKGKITIRGEQKANRTILSIEDNGLGMSSEYAAKLFTNTPSESRYGTKGEKGTGIGLQLCKEFIAGNNGTITVTSTPGLGSTFYLNLPATS